MPELPNDYARKPTALMDRPDNTKMKFSICIPNYNYGRYVAETIRSALDQEAEVEVLVVDNDSNDDSVAAVDAIDDSRLHLRRNRWNVGFAGNLDRACVGATGDRMILLSSDDLAGPRALGTYARLAQELGVAAERAVFCSSVHVVDSAGAITGSQGYDTRLWADAREDKELSTALGSRVLRVPARALLARAVSHLRNPFNFAATCYPRELYEAVEGYGGGALINPDKVFAWKLLSVAEEVLWVDEPLFSYRVHDANQTAQQLQSGALKHLIDQYRSTFDTAPLTLSVAGLSRDDLARAFIEHDIALRGLQLVADGHRELARRYLDFGRAAYPAHYKQSRRVWSLRVALALGPLGTLISSRLKDTALQRYREGGVIGG